MCMSVFLVVRSRWQSAEWCGPDGSVVLIRAVRSGLDRVVLELLRAGVPVNNTDHTGNASLSQLLMLVWLSLRPQSLSISKYCRDHRSCMRGPCLQIFFSRCQKTCLLGTKHHHNSLYKPSHFPASVMAAMDQKQRRPVAYDTALRLTMSQITENLHQQIPNICLDILVINSVYCLKPFCPQAISKSNT